VVSSDGESVIIPTQRGVRLGAALFNGDHGRLAEEVARIEVAGLDFIHLDVFDGYFVPDIGFAPRTIAALRSLTRLPFEVHLGVNEPLRFAPSLVDVGVDLIIPHIESTRMIHETIFAIRALGVRVGVALALGTALDIIEPVIGQVDAILLLSRVTGEGVKGAGFDPRVLSRLSALRSRVTEAEVEIDIQVAGGVNRDNAGELVREGANSLALGAGIYRVSDMRSEVATVRELVAAKRGGDSRQESVHRTNT
jgi:ribulose-phosphate 3-epimerase